MKDQKWNDPGARASASEANIQSGRDWFDNNLRRVAAASSFSRAIVDCDPEDRLDILEDAHEFLRAGWPMVAFGSVMDEATFWANTASRAEHKAYALACFNRLSPEDQAGFLEYVQRGKPA